MSECSCHRSFFICVDPLLLTTPPSPVVLKATDHEVPTKKPVKNSPPVLNTPEATLRAHEETTSITSSTRKVSLHDVHSKSNSTGPDGGSNTIVIAVCSASGCLILVVVVAGVFKKRSHCVMSGHQSVPISEVSSSSTSSSDVSKPADVGALRSIAEEMDARAASRYEESQKENRQARKENVALMNEVLLGQSEKQLGGNES